MKSLTLKQKRLVAGIWLVVFLFAVGNEYLEWSIFGDSAKAFRIIVMGVGVVGIFRFGPRMCEEIDAQVTAAREAEEIAERGRDKSNDAIESERVRRAIGMPPNSSPERTREE